VKITRWFSVPALAASLLMGGAGLALADGETSKKEVASFGSLRTADVKVARADAEAWLKQAGKTDAATQKAFADLWDGEGAVMTKVTETICLGDPAAKKLLDEARNPKIAAPTEVPALIKDKKLPAFYRANLALAYGKALSSPGRRVYEEALEALESVKPEQVADPGAYLFYRAVAEHGLMKRTEAVRTVVRMLDDVTDAPDRYKTVSLLMVLDMATWQEKDLGSIARKMDNIERRLDLSRGGPKTQKLQKDVIARLDELIKEKEGQCNGNCNGGNCPSGGQSGKNPNNTTNPSSPQDDSYGGTGSGPGKVDPKKLEELASNWGKLPPKERAEAMAELTRGMPPRYRDVIEKYFKRLAESGN
jgi:hypothetical protein